MRMAPGRGRGHLCWWPLIFTSIHKPPASIRFAPIKHALAVTVEPFKFSPAEPVAYELSYPKCEENGHKHVSDPFRQHLQNAEPSKISRSSYLRRIRQLMPFKLGVPNCRPNFSVVVSMLKLDRSQPKSASILSSGNHQP
jgi:hypothetical protein